MKHYYNEIDPFCADWIENLIREGLIPDGYVDRRSIEDVSPVDLIGFRQHRFFAGIAGWPLALQLAGWPADRPVWTGSCPCQPFSAAGKRGGFADERHLWPAFHWLIRQYRPDIVFGEQVEGPAGRAWLDLVCTDLEADRYACGAVVFPAAGVGAPHQRHRLYWLAYDNHGGLEGRGQPGRERGVERVAGAGGVVGGMAQPDQGQRGWRTIREEHVHRRQASGRDESEREFESGGTGSGMADAASARRDGPIPHAESDPRDETRVRVSGSDSGLDLLDHAGRPGAAQTVWGASDWLFCRDGKWRPVEPESFPLANGLPARVGRLRGYGNAIVPQQAAEFVKSAMEYGVIL